MEESPVLRAWASAGGSVTPKKEPGMCDSCWYEKPTGFCVKCFAEICGFCRHKKRTEICDGCACEPTYEERVAHDD